ncbi:hypothetical protein NLG97_g2018 [Lecanicillium saksenae]|uniref:Uncharacterized protein n=1 Tax=Lecanicillium saksenae TaxID=468837 RepID=A0ACC1R240_9HYPO|nr:hypothetical protein NLG97_g2018 [Lecanicillium saksenae]
MSAMTIPTTPFLSESDRSESSMDLNDATFKNEQWTRKKGSRNLLRIIIHAVVMLLAFWGAFSMSISLLQPHKIRQWLDFPSRSQSPNPYYPETLPQGLNICDCGKTTREALSRDCVYDSLAAAWLPPYCRDAELTSEFEVSGPGREGQWPYYADEAGTIPITIPEIAALGEISGTFWALREWHVAHCLFYWQKYTRMRDTGIIMEQRFDHIAHVRHCQSMALKPKPTHSVLVEVDVVMNSTLLS